MSVRGNAAPRGMTAQGSARALDRIRLTGSSAESHDSPGGSTPPGLTIFAGSVSSGSATIKYMLRVKRLAVGARVPVVAHPGEDLGYDIFALEGAVLNPRTTVRVRTGIAVEARDPKTGAALGLLLRDRSSMAARGIATTGGVIDAGYRGEIQVLMTNLGPETLEIQPGEKIAQMIPVPVLTGVVEEVETLEESARAEKGFGSSGR